MLRLALKAQQHNEMCVEQPVGLLIPPLTGCFSGSGRRIPVLSKRLPYSGFLPHQIYSYPTEGKLWYAIKRKWVQIRAGRNHLYFIITVKTCHVKSSLNPTAYKCHGACAGGLPGVWHEALPTCPHCPVVPWAKGACIPATTPDSRIFPPVERVATRGLPELYMALIGLTVHPSRLFFLHG